MYNFYCWSETPEDNIELSEANAEIIAQAETFSNSKWIKRFFDSVNKCFFDSMNKMFPWFSERKYLILHQHLNINKQISN